MWGEFFLWSVGLIRVCCGTWATEGAGAVCEMLVVVATRGGGSLSVWVEGVIVTVHTWYLSVKMWCMQSTLSPFFGKTWTETGGKVKDLCWKRALLNNHILWFCLWGLRIDVYSWCKEKAAAGEGNPGSCWVWLGWNVAPSWTPQGFGCDGCTISMFTCDGTISFCRKGHLCAVICLCSIPLSLKRTYQYRAASWSLARVQIFIGVTLIILFVIKCQVQRQ